MHAKRKKIYKKNNAGSNLFKELWNAAVALRGSIEPADYKRYVLPLIFLRFLSLRYEQRVSEIDAEIADPQSDLFTRDKQLAREIREDPDNFIKKNVFLVPEDARWDNVVKIARRTQTRSLAFRSRGAFPRTFPRFRARPNPGRMARWYC
jgi:type I restriction enzyme M protein